jgi:hypothetical protein
MVWCVHVERVSTTRTPVRFAVRSNHGHRLPQPDPDGITTAQLAGTASRYASRQPLDVEAGVAELREIATGRGDLLAERAGVILAFRDEDERDGRWPRRSLEAAPCIAPGADLTRLTERLAEGRSGKSERPLAVDGPGPLWPLEGRLTGIGRVSCCGCGWATTSSTVIPRESQTEGAARS